MKYTKNELSGIAEAIRTYNHNDNPDATEVTLRECSEGERTLLKLQINVNLLKITDGNFPFYVGNLGIQNLIRGLLDDKSVVVEDMAIAIYNDKARIHAYVWTA